MILSVSSVNPNPSIDPPAAGVVYGNNHVTVVDVRPQQIMHVFTG
jgi:hypothetical protein